MIGLIPAVLLGASTFIKTFMWLKKFIGISLSNMSMWGHVLMVLQHM